MLVSHKYDKRWSIYIKNHFYLERVTTTFMEYMSACVLGWAVRLQYCFKLKYYLHRDVYTDNLHQFSEKLHVSRLFLGMPQGNLYRWSSSEVNNEVAARKLTLARHCKQCLKAQFANEYMKNMQTVEVNSGRMTGVCDWNSWCVWSFDFF